MLIKDLRLKKGWTQEDLARHSGLSTRTIQRAERGESIGSESMKCLAAVFEIPFNSSKQRNLRDDTKCVDTHDIKWSRAEASAVKFAHSLFKTPKKSEPEPLTKIERDAINYGKSLFDKLKLK